MLKTKKTQIAVFSIVVLAVLSNSCFLFHTRSKYTHLHECAKAGDTSCVIKELAKGSPGLKIQDDAGMTALHIASSRCHLEIVKLLLELGADVNEKAKEGATPLHFAAQEDCLETVKFLLESGADINAKDDEGRTPLVRAIQWENEDIASYLQASGGQE